MTKNKQRASQSEKGCGISPTISQEREKAASIQNGRLKSLGTQASFEGHVIETKQGLKN